MAFAKGHAANPDGRRIEAQVKRAARAEGENCVKVLAAVRDDQSAPAGVRAQAALRLLDLARWNRHHPGGAAAAGAESCLF